jgi:hypothetical protein
MKTDMAAYGEWSSGHNVKRTTKKVTESIDYRIQTIGATEKQNLNRKEKRDCRLMKLIL